MRRWLVVPLVLGLTACGMSPPGPEGFFARKRIPVPTAERFPHCRSYGCEVIEYAALNDSEWKNLAQMFPAKNAADERARIAKAIVYFEQRVGLATGTTSDMAGTFLKLGPDQLDCVDESTNTTVYLTLLNQKSWLKFHDVLSPTARTPLMSGYLWPHITAVVREKASGDLYAVDSWFRDNGTIVDVVPLAEWRDGWHPPKDQ